MEPKPKTDPYQETTLTQETAVELDLDTADNVTDFISVPAGTYLCSISEVREGKTRNGDARWSMRLTVAEGEYAGRFASFDSLVFSKRGLNRVRKVLAALGLPSRGRVDIKPENLEGRRAFVEVRPSEYMSPSGDTIRQNEVPYDGYRPMGDEGGEGDDEDTMADVPF
ncbi:MAG: DUF669 domain-containing protein [Planctomycetota bacterium]